MQTARLPITPAQEQNPEVLTHDDMMPYRRLVAAVLQSAIRDLHSCVGEHRDSAAEFLAGPDARHYAELIDLPDWLPVAALLIHADEQTLGRIEMPPELREATLRHRAERSAPREDVALA